MWSSVDLWFCTDVSDEHYALIFDLSDGGSMFLRNTVIQQEGYTAQKTILTDVAQSV
jgi:hypothetical protein